MADLEQHEGLEVTHEQIEQEWAHAYMSSTQPPIGGLGRPRAKKKSGPGGMIIMVTLAAAVAAGSYFVYTNQKQVSAKKAMNDLQQGVITASGIRGHLVTKWENKQTRYMLKIEPIDPRQDVEFAAILGAPQMPMSITVRVLDATGFALCGKEILIPFDPSKAAATARPGSKRSPAPDEAALSQAAAQEQAREKGNDIFRRVYNQDGKVEGLWAEGALPCSPDQYDRSDYWDMTTTMPTIAEQDKMTGKTTPVSKPVSEDDRKAAAAHKKLLKPVTSAFYVEGDEYASSFEPARGILWAGPGHHFTLLRKTDLPTVAAWSDDGALVHFKCDQHAGCFLNRAGSTNLIPARMNE